jgi:single-stranded-DNA-specific exonuclease
MTAVAIRPTRRRRLPEDFAEATFPSLHPLLARLYASRGVTRESELDYSLRELAPVSSLDGVGEAVDLLMQHRDRHITVVGDFDADGATATALVLRCLGKFGFRNVDYLVPNRFEFGYGLTPEIVQVAARSSPDLLITVDNGVSCIEGVREARELGLEVLVTDHHLPGAELPAASAMVNPNLAGSRFASPHMAGVGVAFYVMAALGRRLEGEGHSGAAKVPAAYLDLVALGTVADVVQLDRNNRILVAQGLERIRSGRCVPGIRALLQQAARSQARAVSSDLAFAVGPRLNAAGRMEDMSIGIECLLTDDPQTAGELAADLDAINKTRRTVEANMRDQAFGFVDRMDQTSLPPCVCVFEADWHQGIVGLVASRVKDRWHRPAIAFAREGPGRLKGSARSVAGVNIRDLLEAVASANPGMIAKYGGHAMAAGLSIPESEFDRFAAAAATQLSRLYPDANFSGAIVTDGDLPGEAMTLEFARTLREAGPWGAGFPEPTFCGRFSVLEQRTVGENHLKLKVRCAGRQASMDAIAFNQAGSAWRGVVELTYRLDVNEYRGVESPQLVVEQIAGVANR